MKKFLFIALIAVGINAKAQIALENVYKGGENSWGYLSIVHLTSAGYKYQLVDFANNNIKLYDLNHTLYKTINIPIQPQPLSGNHFVYALSDELFNTNSSDIEYLLYNNNAQGNPHITVYDEVGNILLTRDTVNVNITIMYTSLGVKLILYNGLDSNSSVYSLPGILPCNDCTNGVVSGLAPSGGGYGNEIGVSNSYPNPAINSTRIDYTFPSGINAGEIVFYDLQGREIKRYKVDKTFDHLLISTADIPAGTYFYQLQTSNQASEGKKMVVVK